MQIITSKDNETVKNIKKLKDKKYRDEAGLYIIEGMKMIEEAIDTADREGKAITEMINRARAIL